MIEKLKALIPSGWKKSIKMLVNKKFKKETIEFERIKKLPRFLETDTFLFDVPVKITDGASYLFISDEIFKKEIYKFETKSPSPYILDCGANIGLSIIYFKRLFPDAEIVGFEPDGNTFDALKYNIASFNLSKVTLVKKACWSSETTLQFFSEGADGGRVAKENDKENIIEVETIRLKNYLNRKVDFLKMDIEGAESEIIPDIAGLLVNVDNIFVEFHSFIGQEQKLPEILTVLKAAGFHLHISAPGLTSQNPFIELSTYANMDNQLNIYGIRKQ